MKEYTIGEIVINLATIIDTLSTISSNLTLFGGSMPPYARLRIETEEQELKEMLKTWSERLEKARSNEGERMNDTQTRPMKDPDPNVSAVVQKLFSRSRVGLEKYGCSTDAAGLSKMEWLQHLQEELMDACVYIETLLKGGDA